MTAINCTDTSKDYLTDKAWVLNDPLEKPAPRGVLLLVLNPGMVLHKAMWYDEALAWGPLPVVPQSVKDRHNGRKT